MTGVQTCALPICPATTEATLSWSGRARSNATRRRLAETSTSFRPSRAPPGGNSGIAKKAASARSPARAAPLRFGKRVDHGQCEHTKKGGNQAVGLNWQTHPQQRIMDEGVKAATGDHGETEDDRAIEWPAVRA